MVRYPTLAGICRGLEALVAAAIVALAGADSCGDFKPPVTNAVLCSGADDTKPELIWLGDSITAMTNPANCTYNNAYGYYTSSFFVGGHSAASWLDDTGAMFVMGNSRARAVYVELGTNDLIQVTLGSQTMDGVKANIAAIASKFGDRCIVWQGQNEQFAGVNGGKTTPQGVPTGGTIISTAQAATYNAALRDYANNHSTTFHVADFNGWVATNTQLRDGIRADPSKIHPLSDDSRRALALLQLADLRASCRP